MFKNPRRGGQARNYTEQMFRNSSRSQIVFRTNIFWKLTLGGPGEIKIDEVSKSDH